MSEKTLKFDNIRVNKKKFNKSKQPIVLMSVNVDQMVTTEKFKYSDEGFKYLLVTKKVKMKLLNLYLLSCLK